MDAELPLGEERNQSLLLRPKMVLNGSWDPIHHAGRMIA
jgi:hypothetical protein